MISRIMFLGQKKIAEDCFSYLHGKGMAEVACSNMGQEGWWKSNEIFEFTTTPFIPNETRNEAEILKAIKQLKINTLISVQHPWILSDRILKAVSYRAFNLHNAKLPDYMGCNAVNHAILNGDKTYTVTVHWMKKKVDTGDIAFEETFKIPEGITAIGLYKMANEHALILFRKLINYLSTGKAIPRKPIIGEGVFHKRNSIDGHREISDELIAIDSKARAFYFPPFEPAYIKHWGNKYYVLPKEHYEDSILRR